MDIYTLSFRKMFPRNAKLPCLVLYKDAWDDFGYKTLFRAKWYWSRSEGIDLGQLKILQKGQTETELPKHFDHLGHEFCSLGQSLSYYEQIRELGSNIAVRVLTALRDIVKSPQIARVFESEKGFADSVLRFSEAEKAFREGSMVLRERSPGEKDKISFTFADKLPQATTPHEVKVRFGGSELLPSRIVVFIGRNGTGKTWLLSRLAAHLSGDERSAKLHFKPRRPSFSRVIAVSYNALDKFRRPRSRERTFSYKYCGIYTDRGQVIPRERLLRRVAKSYSEIADTNKHDLLLKVLTDVFDSSFARQCRRGLASEEPSVKLGELSSGQMILLTVLTELLLAIKPESLILYDEPELHLHPNAIAGLMRGFSKILERFDSYAIVATHSPLILQQIPSDYVRIFTRIQNQTFIHKLEIESFGENLTTLTDEVFQVNEAATIFREWLKSIPESASEKEIVESFKQPLSFNAKTLIRTVLRRSDRKGDNKE